MPRVKLHALPAGETAKVLAGALGQLHVDLRDLRSGPATGVTDGEGRGFLCAVHMEISVFVSGVGEAVTERKEGLLAFRLEPLVTEAHALGEVRRKGLFLLFRDPVLG